MIQNKDNVNLIQNNLKVSKWAVLTVYQKSYITNNKLEFLYCLTKDI